MAGPEECLNPVAVVDPVGEVEDECPGEVNLMTAGHGIAHSEVSTADSQILHGVQLWVALPERHRDAPPELERYVPRPVVGAGSRILVFVGSLAGESSPVTTYSPLVGAEIGLDQGAARARRFGTFPEAWAAQVLPAPGLPNARLKPRG